MLKWLPHEPRCSMCGVPFEGLGGTVARLVGYRQWNKNPTLCNLCYRGLPDGGIETDVAIMFADFRGSTSMAEKLAPTEFADILNRFYHVAIEVLAPHRAIIDKMIGDEVMAFFTPMGTSTYRKAAVDAAIELMERFPEVLPGEATPRLGIGVHAGPAYVGKVGDRGVKDLTALGDTINTAARLQAKAASGEILVSEEVYDSISGSYHETERRSLELRGKEQSIEVRVLRAPRPA